MDKWLNFVHIIQERRKEREKEKEEQHFLERRRKGASYQMRKDIEVNRVEVKNRRYGN